MYGSIKGAERRVIVLQTTGSELFDSAYFIIKEGARTRGASEGDMIREANRIITRGALPPASKEHGRLSSALCTLAGALLGGGGMLALTLIF